MKPAVARTLLLGASVLCSVCASTSDVMAAFVADSSSSSSFHYDDAFPVPALGKLHEDLTGLPDDAAEVLLEVLCSSVNPSDLSTDNYLKPKPLGSDVVGRVVSTNGSTVFNIGDIVWGDIGSNALLASDPSVTTKELGAYAQYAVALDTQLSLAPLLNDDTTYGGGGGVGNTSALLTVCSLPKVALTTYKALVWYAGAPWDSPSAMQTRPTNVLVLGGSGGTGSVGIQLAKFLGAATVATTASPDNFDYCTSLGATQVIDYHTQDWMNPGEVFEEGFLDVIYDTVGQAGSAAAALNLLSKHGGRYVTIAGALVPSFQVPAGTTQANFINSDTNLESSLELEALKAVVEQGALAMPSISVYGLDQLSEAFATSKAGHVVGKLVISVSNDTTTAVRPPQA